jgi:hypothetical protein
VIEVLVEIAAAIGVELVFEVVLVAIAMVEKSHGLLKCQKHVGSKQQLFLDVIESIHLLIISNSNRFCLKLK